MKLGGDVASSEAEEVGGFSRVSSTRWFSGTHVNLQKGFGKMLRIRGVLPLEAEFMFPVWTVLNPFYHAKSDKCAKEKDMNSHFYNKCPITAEQEG